MGFNFSQWLVIQEVFRLDVGRALTLSEALELPSSKLLLPKSIEDDPISLVQKRVADVHKTYKPGPYSSDPIAAAVVGLKPAAILSYLHHPENPAAQIVSDVMKKNSTGNMGAIQAELLKHGIKVRPDFHMIHMNLPGYSTAQIIIGGRKNVEELWQLYKCQYYLDFVSSDDHSHVTPDLMKKVNDMLHGKCQVFCNRGEGGMNCKPIHKRIGELLGYTDEQVDKYINDPHGMPQGYGHMPDVEYPFGLPPSLADAPRKKGFSPHESRIQWSSRYKTTNII